MPTIFGKEYENSPRGAIEFQFDLMNPFDTNPQMFALRTAYGTGIGFGGFGMVALITGEAMPSLFQQSVIRAFGKAQRLRNTVVFVAKFAPQIALVASAAAQAEVWQEIGDPKTGAVHFAGAGGFIGGSMPVVPSGDTSSPSGGLSWKSFLDLF